MTGRRTVYRQKLHKNKSELTVLLFLPAIDCGKLQAPQNGSVFGRNTTYPHTLRFTCDVGFSLFGSSDRKCQANGTWSGTNALCQGEKSVNQGYLPFTWENRKFQLENQMVRDFPFGKLKKICAVI